MSTPVKSVATSILTLQQLASNSVLVSAVQSVTTKFSAQFGIHLGRDDTGGVLAAGVAFRIEGSMKSSADDQWFPVAEYTSGTATPEAEAVSGTEAAASTVIEVASTSNLAAGDIILFKNTTIANSEWGRIKSIVANTSITVIDGITNAQTGSTIYDQGEFWSPVIDLLNLTRIRLVVDGSGTGRTVVVESYMNTCDSIG
jgi:hypothetical protein